MALRFPSGAGVAIAKPKSRKRPAAQPCACIPLEQEGESGKCVYCDKPATARARFSLVPTRPVSFREHVPRQFLDTRSGEC